MNLLISLIATDEPFDPAKLIAFFEENIYNRIVMSDVAHVIATSKTTDISVWLRSQLLKEYTAFERSALVKALPSKGGFRNTKELVAFLKKIYDKYPISVIEMMRKHGTEDDIKFLQEKLVPVKRAESRDVEKLITHLQKKAAAKKK